MMTSQSPVEMQVIDSILVGFQEDLEISAQR